MSATGFNPFTTTKFQARHVLAAGDFFHKHPGGILNLDQGYSIDREMWKTFFRAGLHKRCNRGLVIHCNPDKERALHHFHAQHVRGRARFHQIPRVYGIHRRPELINRLSSHND